MDTQMQSTRGTSATMLYTLYTLQLLLQTFIIWQD